MNYLYKTTRSNKFISIDEIDPVIKHKSLMDFFQQDAALFF